MKKGIIELTNSLRLDRKKTIRISVLLILTVSLIIFCIVKSNASKKEELDKKFKETPTNINYVSEESFEKADEKNLESFLNENKVDELYGQEIDLSEYKKQSDNPLEEIEEKESQASNINRIEPVSNNNFGDNNSYQTELENEKKNNENLNQEVSRLRAEISSLKANNQNVNTSLSSMNNNNDNTKDLQNKLDKKQEEVQKLLEENKQLKEKLKTIDAKQSEVEEFIVTKELINKKLTEISISNLDEIKSIIQDLESDSHILLVSSEENLISIAKDQDKIIYKLYGKLDENMDFDKFTNEVVKLEKDNNYENNNIDIRDITEEDLYKKLDKKELIIQKELSYDR